MRHCEGHPDCIAEPTASFRVVYEGEHLYTGSVCAHHEKLYDASKFAERVE